ncbi:hypothetical protein [Mumia sp. Pv 4-285]|uniref:hypothetical protein n=1 Tax=Mumia qirimensis TaxID=3234852 RepID=UPI00351D01C4
MPTDTPNPPHAQPQVSPRLLELADVFAFCRSAFLESADRYHWTPAESSPAEQDATVLPSPDPAIVDPQGETGFRLVAEVVQTYMLAASGHLGGLESMYATGEVHFSPGLLVRAVMENCAHALWVLGEDGDDPEERLARAYLEELKSAEEAQGTAKLMGGSNSSQYQNARARHRLLRRQLQGRFAVSPDELGTGQLRGQTLPGLTDSVRWMYDLAAAAGGTIDSRGAEGIYGFLSNLTHPTLYPIKQMRVWIHDETAGHAVAHLRLDVAFSENLARVALAAFYNTLTYVTSYFGWPIDLIDGLTARLDEAIPGFLI